MGLKELVLGSIIWLLLIVFLSLPVLILLIWKSAVILIVKCIRKDLRVLSLLDIMVTPGGLDKSIINFGFVCTVEGDLSLQDLQVRFTEKFLQLRQPGKYEIEKFHSSLVSFGGFMFAKIVDRIDIEEQICIKNLKEGQILEDLLSEWLLTRYHHTDSPFWQMIVVPLKAKNETAVAFKIHHAFADGYSVLYLWDELTGGSSPYLVKDFQETWGHIVSKIIEFPYTVMSFMPQYRFYNPFPCVKEEKVRWSMAFTRLDLGLLKKIRRQHDVQISVLILSLFSGVLRKYLLETKTPEEIPTYLNMITTTAWPRHPSRDPSIPKNDRICNHWSSVPIKVPLIDDDPLKRLLESQKNFKSTLDSGSSKAVTRVMPKMTWLMPSSMIGGMASADLGLTGGYSTTLGGDGYKLLGKTVSRIHPLICMADSIPFTPLSIFTFSHSNHYEITLSVNRQQFPNRELMTRLLEQELPHEIQRLCILSGISNSLDE